MKKILSTLAITSMLSTGAMAADVKIGVMLGFTGPIESITALMGKAADFAVKEVNNSGAFMGGKKIKAIRADSTCIDAAAATAAAENLITSEKVSAIVGAACSGATGAALKNIAVPKGMLMISPSATSPALTHAKDNGYFFRMAPSDARQGEIIADILKEKGYKSAALTYTNNDYGKGLAESIEKNFKKLGGKITINAAHEDGKADYSAEVASMASAGGDILIVAGYMDQGGKGIIQAALDTDAFDNFFLPDAMIGDTITDTFGSDLNGAIGSSPGSTSTNSANFEKLLASNGVEKGAFVPETYDAIAVTVLAMQSAKSTDSAKVKNHVMRVSNAPGVKIGPGEIAKGLKILADGGDIDYQGASDVELVEPGESAGSFREYEIKNAKFVVVRGR